MFCRSDWLCKDMHDVVDQPRSGGIARGGRKRYNRTFTCMTAIPLAMLCASDWLCKDIHDVVNQPRSGGIGWGSRKRYN